MCTGEEKEHGSSIPTSVSMLVNPLNLSYSAVTVGEQMNKKTLLGERVQKASKVMSSSFP